MIDFIQKQIEASERLFEMMREDHKERMKEIEIWADASQTLMKKLDERDRLIAILREDNRHQPGPTTHDALERQEEVNALRRRIKILEIQLDHLAEDNRQMIAANTRLRDDVQKLTLDLGLREAGIQGRTK
jgi:hypothetical protein